MRKILIKNLRSKTLKFLLIGFLFSVLGTNAITAPAVSDKATGKTTDVPVLDKMELPYVYSPVDPDYWRGVEQKIKDKEFTKIIADGLDLTDDYGYDSDDGIEGMLSVGVALRHLDLNYAATLVLKEVALKRISSEIAAKALYELSLIDQNSYLDPVDMIDDFLNSNEFGTLHPDIQSFVSYYVSLSDLINGFKNWSKIEGGLVKNESYWYFRTQYLKAINEVTQNKLDEAEVRFSRISKNETLNEKIRKRADLQIARISFEKKDFVKAGNIYKTLIDFPQREKARILLERAWANFYQKNYSESLGILQGLKAPIYMVAVTPERYILEMIIYKQLCYFEKVSRVAKEYYAVFGKSVKNIKKRKDLSKDKIVSQMALTNMRLQDQANFINQLRDEALLAKELGVNKFKYLKTIADKYSHKDQEVQKRLYQLMDNVYPQVSEEILDAEEQVKFLDYTAKLDALRIVKKGEERNYQSEKISYVKFDKVFWPVEEEYWSDELVDYKVLIKSQCDQALPPSSSDEGIIRQFGEEFK